MKGVVFTEFMEMMDCRFGPELTERVLEAAHPPSGGIYTAVGTYDHTELLALVEQLSHEVGLPAATLVREFGHYLFGRFVKSYPRFFENVHSAFDFIEQVDNHVHVEVLKLYPGAELPSFRSERPDDRRMLFDYRSSRPLADLAEGLIAGCADHYGERMDIERLPLAADGGGTAVRFQLTRVA